MFKAEGMDAVILQHNIDSPFITQLEQRNQNVKFQRIDADITETFKKEQASEDEVNTLTEIFRKALENDNICRYRRWIGLRRICRHY